jgi:hypothetical protein
MWSYRNLVGAGWRLSHLTPEATFRLKFTDAVLTFIEHVQCSGCLREHVAQAARSLTRTNYRIFSNLIRTLFTVSEGQIIRCGLESRAD